MSHITNKTEMGGMRNVWILSVAMGILAICYTMLVPFLPIYLFELGVEQDQVALWSGLTFSITFFVAGIMAPIWGKLADKHSKKIMAVRAGIAIGISYIFIGFVTDPWQLLLGRAFQGFANGFMPAAMTMISLSVKEKKVGTALGIFQTGLILGNVIGPVLGGFVESYVGMRPVFYVSGAMVIAVTLVVAFLVKEPKIISTKTPENDDAKHTKNSSLLDDWKQVKSSPVLVKLLWLNFFMQCSILMLQPIIALYVGEMRGSMENAAFIAGIILSVGGLMGAVTTNIWVRYGGRVGYFRVVSIALIVVGCALFLQALPFGIYWFGALQIIIGTFAVGINPSLSAAVSMYTEPVFRGRMFGMTTMAQQFGSMIGPLFASIISTYAGYSSVFIISSIVMLYMSYSSHKSRHL